MKMFSLLAIAMCPLLASCARDAAGALLTPIGASASLGVDSVHATTQRRRLDVVAADLAHYCGTNKAAAYLCDDRAMIDSARALEVTTVTPPDTTTPPLPPPTSGRWVTGYWVGYQRSLYPETSVDFSALTHIIVGRLGVTSTGGVVRDFFLDPTTGPQVATTLSTRAHQSGRKALLMVGGSDQHANLSGAIATANVDRFVANLVSAMSDLGFDGIDIDLEPITSADKPLMLALIQKLRAAKSGIIITAPIGWTPDLSSDAWYVQLAAAVDQANIMSYGMADAWPGWVSWHSSALAGDGGDHPSSITLVVNRWRALGIPAAKLGIGLGFYGSCWRGPNAPLQAPGSGVIASDNTMSYTNIMANYYSSTSAKYDATANASYLGFATTTGPQGCTMVSYENAQSITAKGNYVKAQGLGGAIIWTVNQGPALLASTFAAIH